MDEFEILCPWCGEALWIQIESDVRGELIQDCEVCCQPMVLHLSRDQWGDPDLRIEQGH